MEKYFDAYCDTGDNFWQKKKKNGTDGTPQPNNYPMSFGSHLCCTISLGIQGFPSGCVVGVEYRGCGKLKKGGRNLKKENISHMASNGASITGKPKRVYSFVYYALS